MVKLYQPIIKLGEAEIKALEKSSDMVLNHIEPIIEITRGRKSVTASRKKESEPYPFDNRLARIKDIFKGKDIAIDLTSDEALLNEQIIQLYDPNNGYEKWISFLCKLKDENVFHKITPCLIINGTDSNFTENLKRQADSLIRNFGNFIYRSSIIDENCYSDLSQLDQYLKKIIVLIDCDYVIQPQRNEVSKKVSSRIDNLNKLSSNSIKTYIVCGTSFPKNISDIGDDVSDEFILSEVKIFEEIKKKHHSVIYSDYASVNPIRNDKIIMARGWIPRIDIPLEDRIYYIRQRRPKGVSKYAPTYSDVARQIIRTTNFPWLKDNWGIAQIINCAEGAAPSSSPSFWISVRMCIHLEQQCKRIYSI